MEFDVQWENVCRNARGGALIPAFVQDDWEVLCVEEVRQQLVM